MNNLSIKYKVLLITILPVFITACLLSFVFIKERLKDTEVALNEKGQTISKYLAPALEYGILSGNQDYLNALVKNTLSIPEVSSVTILNANQHILVHQSRHTEKSSHTPKNAASGMFFSTNIYRSEIGIDDIDSYDNSTGGSDNEVIGMLVVEISRNGISMTQKEIIGNGVLITFISLFLTILLALYFSRTVSSPISLLTKGIHRIRDGILGERIYTGAGGEIAILEIGINNMSASLQLAQLREKEHADDRLFIEKSKAQITLEAIGEGVITTDINGYISYLNPAAENLLGVNMDYAAGMHLHKIFHIKNMTEKESINYPISTCLEEGKSVRHDDSMVLIGANGTEFIIRDNATPLRTRNGKITGMVLVFHDFTHIQRISDQLTYQATHDELTGLRNRREFEHRLKDLITNSNFETQKHALCFLDLDHFKIVNDTCGHIAGDTLLKEVSQLLCSQVRHNDLVARLGGDEFGIILVNCPLKQAVLIAENIKNSVKQYQCRWEQHVFEIGVSIGLMPITSAEYSPAEIMINADAACYVAKDNGKNRVHVYRASDYDFLQRHDEIRWLQKINRALDKDSFELYCQAMVPANNKSEEVKYEVLLRLQDDDELMLPGYFLPAAEHYSLMPEIDRWVIKTFVALLGKNDFRHFRDKKQVFNINISGQSLCSEGFFEFIVDLFESSPVSLQLITFEITETAAIHNYNAAINLISRLQKRGCAFALDDFGSGLSSFRYLKELPVDYLKIDGYFIRNIESSRVNQSIVDAISSVAQALSLKTIAEFVESEEAWQVLKKYGVDYLQGSAIEMPVPLTEVLARFKND
ncbi:MAG TPA: EAL domain-containing protein [Gammaproteobacteria bacterium]|nr:EAL domain-containing protein [Gammaproteobacteria bacterium]